MTDLIKTTKGYMLQSSDDMVDAELKKLIHSWNENTKPINVLEALDKSIHYSWTSGFWIRCLQILYDSICKHYNTTHEEVVKNAVWRNELV